MKKLLFLFPNESNLRERSGGSTHNLFAYMRKKHYLCTLL